MYPYHCILPNNIQTDCLMGIPDIQNENGDTYCSLESIYHQLLGILNPAMVITQCKLMTEHEALKRGYTKMSVSVQCISYLERLYRTKSPLLGGIAG